MDLYRKRWLYIVAAGVPAIVIIIITLLVSQASVNTVRQTPLNSDLIMIIDPGHGYPDGGTTSCTGALEADLNLEISLRLQDLFQFLGVRTVITRSTPESVYTSGDTISQKKISDLKNRVRFINSIDNGYLLSIHQNHFYDSQYYGAQVFYAGVAGSEDMARRLQSALISGLDSPSNRKAKKSSGVYLMEHIQVPGVLIECGFLSNSREEGLLRSEQYQKQLCGVIVTGCLEYMNQQQVS